MSDVGELSTLDGFRNSSQEGNNKLRNNNGYKIKVSTVSLNDIFTKFFDSKPIDYMSVDSEGSELTILEGFDFKNFGPTIITVEHNEEEDYQKKIDNLLEKNNYRCVLKDYTKFDGWYIKKDHKIER